MVTLNRRGARRPEGQAMIPDPATWVGKTLDDRLRVLSKLGEGGMAYVFLADDLVHGGRVVLKAPKPRALLIDFGLHKVTAERRQAAQQAVQTRLGQVVGTAQCMAPEIILARACDGRLDQYALAVTVFQQLTGRYPFDDADKTIICSMQV